LGIPGELRAAGQAAGVVAEAHLEENGGDVDGCGGGWRGKRRERSSRGVLVTDVAALFFFNFFYARVTASKASDIINQILAK
jgi:hypothetical protein